MILLRRWIQYTICLASFLSLFELCPVFICANNIGSLVNSLFGVKTLIPFPRFTSSSSLSSGDA